MIGINFIHRKYVFQRKYCKNTPDRLPFYSPCIPEQSTSPRCLTSYIYWAHATTKCTGHCARHLSAISFYLHKSYDTDLLLCLFYKENKAP